MTIEPLSTIIAWVIGISVIVFVPFSLVSFIILFIKLIKDS